MAILKMDLQEAVQPPDILLTMAIHRPWVEWPVILDTRDHQKLNVFSLEMEQLVKQVLLLVTQPTDIQTNTFLRQ